MTKSMPSRLVLLATLLLAPLSAAFAAAAGSVTLDGRAWTVVDGIALPEGDKLGVILLSQKFDRAKALEDGTLDSFDAMMQGGDSVTINFDADGPTPCIAYLLRSGGSMTNGSNCSDFAEKIKLAKRTATQIAGSVQWEEASGDLVHVQFDLPIEGAAP